MSIALLTALRDFERSGNPKLLTRWISENGSSESCGHKYPYCHRVRDIELNGSFYRITRCVTCGEAVRLMPIEPKVAYVTEQGVPLGLTGPRLMSWIADEVRSPTKGPQDWGKYEQDE
jgi:hypothetical protein